MEIGIILSEKQIERIKKEWDEIAEEKLEYREYCKSIIAAFGSKRGVDNIVYHYSSLNCEGIESGYNKHFEKYFIKVDFESLFQGN